MLLVKYIKYRKNWNKNNVKTNAYPKNTSAKSLYIRPLEGKRPLFLTMFYEFKIPLTSVFK